MPPKKQASQQLQKGAGARPKAKTPMKEKQNAPLTEEKILTVGTKKYHYLEEGHLGKGSFGKVYKAQKMEGRRVSTVAIKVFYQGEEEDKEFRREATQQEVEMTKFVQLAATPNIIRLFDSGEDEERGKFLVLECCDRRNLEEYLMKLRKNSAAPSFEEDEIVAILRQILNGVGALHDMGVLHLDLKPKNIMVSSKDVSRRVPSVNEVIIKIGDFGSAVRLLEDKDHVFEQIAGSAAYMALEVLEAVVMRREQLKYTRGTDMWSVGAIIFWMFLGQPPFAEVLSRFAKHPKKMYEALYGKYTSKKYNPKAFQEDLIDQLKGNREVGASEFLCNLVMELMTPNPEDRRSVDGVLSHPLLNPDGWFERKIDGLDLGDRCSVPGKHFRLFPNVSWKGEIAFAKIEDPLLNHPKKKIKEEAEALQVLKHQNIVRMFQLLFVNDVYYLVLERCDINLADLLESSSPAIKEKMLPPIVAYKYLKDAASGLDYLHKHGIIHRQISSKHIIFAMLDKKDLLSAGEVCDGGELILHLAKLCDFSMIKQLETFQEYTATSIETSPKDRRFVAPEILQEILYPPAEGAAAGSGQPHSRKVDDYSLMAVFFEVLVGKPFITITATTAAGVNKVKEEIQSQGKPEVLPAALWTLFKKVLTFSQMNRWSVSEVLEDRFMKDQLKKVEEEITKMKDKVNPARYAALCPEWLMEVSAGAEELPMRAAKKTAMEKMKADVLPPRGRKK